MSQEMTFYCIKDGKTSCYQSKCKYCLWREYIIEPNALEAGERIALGWNANRE